MNSHNMGGAKLVPFIGRPATQTPSVLLAPVATAPVEITAGRAKGQLYDMKFSQELHQSTHLNSSPPCVRSVGPSNRRLATLLIRDDKKNFLIQDFNIKSQGKTQVAKRQRRLEKSSSSGTTKGKNAWIECCKRSEDQELAKVQNKRNN